MVRKLLKTLGIIATVLITMAAIIVVGIFVFSSLFESPSAPAADAECSAPGVYTSAESLADATSACSCPVSPLCCSVWTSKKEVSLGLPGGFSRTKTCTLGGPDRCITCRVDGHANYEATGHSELQSTSAR